MTHTTLRDEAYWRKKLTSEQYRVLRGKGTEAPFCGIYWSNKEKGIYHCAACGEVLFSSGGKFDSGTGWPSFTNAMSGGAVSIKLDRSDGEVREEVVCTSCGSHLGHVFNDGPAPSGKRYCINSLALEFKEDASIKR